MSHSENTPTCCTTPNWEDMPEPVCLVTLSWQEVYHVAKIQLGREPTRIESQDLFVEIKNEMADVTGQDFNQQLEYSTNLILKKYFKKQTSQTEDSK